MKPEKRRWATVSTVTKINLPDHVLHFSVAMRCFLPSWMWEASFLFEKVQENT
uniref:Uncharacterized protein n=1 Tax=Anguilla anguilla TaxID=7936 RepID=A0A0E9RAN5_ANGAN